MRSRYSIKCISIITLHSHYSVTHFPITSMHLTHVYTCLNIPLRKNLTCILNHSQRRISTSSLLWNRPRPSFASAVQTSDLLRVSVTTIATFCRKKDTSVTQAGKPYRKLVSFPVWPYIAVYRLLELLRCVKIDISNEFLVLPVGLRVATGSVSCHTGDVLNI